MKRQRLRAKADDSAFFPVRFTLDTGVELDLPRYTLRKDELVRRKVAQLFDHNQEGTSAFLMGGGVSSLAALSYFGIEDEIIEIVSMILDESSEWVEEMLSFSDMMTLIVELIIMPDEDEIRASGQAKTTVSEWTLARTLDFFGKEYGWTIDTVLGLSRWELKAMIDAFNLRAQDEKDAMDKASGKKGRKSRGSPVGGSDDDSCLRRLSAAGRQSVQRAKKGEQWGTDSLLAFAKGRGVFKPKEGEID